MLIRRPHVRDRRRGVAAVEVAILLPFLVFLFVVAVDFARVFYFSLTVANCARNGARYESDPVVKAESPYASLKEAALADASNLNDPKNPPRVSSSRTTDANGNSVVAVTVEYDFPLITHYPGMPDTMTVARTVRMAVAPGNP